MKNNDKVFNQGNNERFELLGFDILLREDLKPFLIEVNHSPSLNISTPLDIYVKSGVLREIFGLMELIDQPLNLLREIYPGYNYQKYSQLIKD